MTDILGQGKLFITVAIREIELLSPDENVETSVLYQNPYWPTTINGTAIE